MNRAKQFTLRSVIALQRGYDLTEAQREPGTVPVVGSAGTHGYHNVARAKAPGITLGRSGGSFGKVTFVREDFWPHNTTIFVTDFKGNDPFFVRYLLETLDFSPLNSGSAQQSLNRNYVYQVPVREFRLKDQKKIAAILSAYDELIEGNQRRIALLEKLAEEIYREWFVRLRFPGHEKVSVIKRLPKGWNISPFSEVVSINPIERIDKEEERPFVAMEELSTSSMYFTYKERRKGHVGPKFRNGDVIFPRITPSVENGKRGLVTTLADGEVAQGSTEFIVFRERILTAEHIYFLSCSEGFRTNAELSMTGASGRQRVQEQCFTSFLVKTPPLELRKEFTGVVRPMVSQIRVLSEQTEGLKSTRDLLLPRLISGKLSVENLDIQFPPGMAFAAAEAP